jgi:hypothetical protein
LPTILGNLKDSIELKIVVTTNWLGRRGIVGMGEVVLNCMLLSSSILELLTVISVLSGM